MCGIYGVYSKSEPVSRSLESHVISHFNKELNHRGPDEHGTFISEDRKVLLGHLRLSIVDIKSGSQPMTSDVGDTVVFNGEIYNHAFLREKHPYNHLTTSDTEVILSGFKLSGHESFGELNGMYAFALYSKDRNTMTLAVDPLGIKSIYIFENDELIIFSSELTALAKFVSVTVPEELEVDFESTYNFFQYGMFLGCSTPFTRIKKLKAGTWIEHGQANSKGLIEYKSTFSSEDSLRNVVEAAVERQLHADVEVCLFLSGGIDSSLIACIASRSKKIKAFCLSFDESDIDESNKAKEVAEDLNIELEIIKIRPENITAFFEQALVALDEPISDFATIPLLALSREASSSYKVCLLGDGGDELFYGYTHHLYWSKKILASKYIPHFIFSSGFYSKLVRAFESINLSLFSKAAIFLKLIHPSGISYGPFAHYENYLLKYTKDKGKVVTFQSLRDFEFENSLGRKLLQKSDRITMAASIEGRVPLLDLEVLSYSKKHYSLGDCIVEGKGKAPLRSLLADSLSSSVYKSKKQGFRVPLSEWCASSYGERVKLQLLECRHVRQFISSEGLLCLFKEFDKGNTSHAVRIFTLYSYSVFMNNVFNKEDL